MTTFTTTNTEKLNVVKKTNAKSVTEKNPNFNIDIWNEIIKSLQNWNISVSFINENWFKLEKENILTFHMLHD